MNVLGSRLHGALLARGGCLERSAPEKRKNQLMDAVRNDQPMAHTVFFTLKEPTPENIERCTSACHQYLANHDGILYFACGSRAAEYSREVNDTDFHVSLHLLFQSSRAHDIYQDHPEHKKFIDECKPLWAKVRVFDDYVEGVRLTENPNLT
jgi:hypothetical protein